MVVKKERKIIRKLLFVILMLLYYFVNFIQVSAVSEVFSDEVFVQNDKEVIQDKENDVLEEKNIEEEDTETNNAEFLYWQEKKQQISKFGTREIVLNEFSTGVVFSAGSVTISNVVDNDMTMASLFSMTDWSKLVENGLVLEVLVFNQEGIVLGLEDKVIHSYKMVVRGEEFMAIYFVSFKNMPVQEQVQPPVLDSSEDSFVSSQVVEAESKKEKFLSEMVVFISNDNYIRDLKIKGYEILFDPNKDYYMLEVDSRVQSLDLDVVLNHDNATYFVYGNENFVEGMNEVIVTVLAVDGSKREYKIDVYKQAEPEDNFQSDIEKVGYKKVPFSRMVIWFVLLFLFIGGVIYFFIHKEE